MKTKLHQYIEEELAKRKTDYLSSPDYLLEHYRIEKQNIEAYNGRQFLEMLQNADDACETAVEKKVLIRLSENELAIANYGEPFTQEGFRSILYSNLSSKTIQKNKIGHKGLGFRSILSWADEVTINSGGTAVSFSEDIASSFLQELTTVSDKVAGIVLEFTKEIKSGDLPIAVLRVPKLLPQSIDCQSKYDTTITIKLKENILDEVQEQILAMIYEMKVVLIFNYFVT